MARLDYEKDHRKRLPKDVPLDPINDAPRSERLREKRHPLLRDIALQTRELGARIGRSPTEDLKEAIARLVSLIKSFYVEVGHSANEIMNARTMIERANDKISGVGTSTPIALPGPGPSRPWKVKALTRSNTRKSKARGKRRKTVR